MAKKENIQELNRLYTLWRTIRWVLPTSLGGTAEITLPRGLSLKNLQGRWIPRATPWWKPQEDITADLMLVAAGGMTFQEMCDKRGLGIWEENVQELAREMQAAEQAGLAMLFNQGKLPVSLRFNSTTVPTEQAV